MPKTDSQTLFCWANMARISLQMWNGFSSHQLVFGKNPKLPGIMTDGLPAFDGTSSSEVFAEHLNALHDSRRAYIQTESNERIRRSLHGKVRAAEEIYERGDMVYYKREGKKRWLGPATVVFQDGKVVFVRHGGVFVRVSPNRLNRIQDKLDRTEIRENSDDFEELKDSINETTKEEMPLTEVLSNPGDPEVNENRGTNIAIGRANQDQDRGGPQSVKVNDIIR